MDKLRSTIKQFVREWAIEVNNKVFWFKINCEFFHTFKMYYRENPREMQHINLYLTR